MPIGVLSSYALYFMLQPSFLWKSGGRNTPHYEEVCRFLNKKSPNLNHLRLGERVEK